MRRKFISILVIGAGRRDVECLERILSDSNGEKFSLHYCDGLDEAISYIQQEEIDLIFLNLSVPNSHRLKAFTNLSTRVPEIPIIILVGTNQTRLAERAMSAGALDYVIKNQLSTALLSKLVRYAVERKEMEKLLRTHKEALDRANTDLEMFAYVVSHDLQEPLRMVKSYLKLLEKRYQDQFDSTACEFINYAVDGAERMKSLIQSMVRYSRVSTRGQPFAGVKCSKILEEVLESLRDKIYTSRARIESTPLPHIWADPTQISQVFYNLIDNSIKFKNNAAPHIQISCDERKDDWLFSVSDNGMGIESRFIDRIFIVFQRLCLRDEFPGNGMGLAICKRIVQRHGGKIWVDSAPGSGATFYFTIPKACPMEGQMSNILRLRWGMNPPATR